MSVHLDSPKNPAFENEHYVPLSHIHDSFEEEDPSGYEYVKGNVFGTKTTDDPTEVNDELYEEVDKLYEIPQPIECPEQKKKLDRLELLNELNKGTKYIDEEELKATNCVEIEKIIQLWSADIENADDFNLKIVNAIYNDGDDNINKGGNKNKNKNKTIKNKTIKNKTIKNKTIKNKTIKNKNKNKTIKNKTIKNKNKNKNKNKTIKNKYKTIKRNRVRTTYSMP